MQVSWSAAAGQLQLNTKQSTNAGIFANISYVSFALLPKVRIFFRMKFMKLHYVAVLSSPSEAGIFENFHKQLTATSPVDLTIMKTSSGSKYSRKKPSVGFKRSESLPKLLLSK